MHKHILSALIALTACAAPALAQNTVTASSVGLRMPTQKGGMMVGSNILLGEMGFGTTRSDVSFAGTYDIGIRPKLGYFVMDNLMVGGSLNVNFNGSNFERQPGDRMNAQAVGVGILVRKYFGKAAEKDGSVRKLRFFVEGGVDYTRGWAKYIPYNNEPALHGAFSTTSVYVMPGFNYFFTRNIALEGGLSLLRIVGSENVYGNSGNLRADLGLQIFLGKRK